MNIFNEAFNNLISEYSNKDLISFIEKRKSGAAKIQKSSEAKGGAAKLTAIHFAAKQVPYKKALSMATKDNCAKKLKQKGDELISKLKSWDTMSQKEFQHVMGQLEAYGEVYIKTIKPDSIKLD
jgi:hypothetical protein